MNLMFWKKKPVGGDEDADDGSVVATSSGGSMPDLAEDVLEEAARIQAARLKKRLLIFGALGLVILLLLGLLIALWKLFFAAKHHEPAPPAPVSEQKTILPSPHQAKNLIKLPDIELPQVIPQVTPQVIPQVNPQGSAQMEGVTQNSPEAMEALKKRNEELEAQLNALQRQQSGAAQRGATPAVGAGQVTLGSKDAKETAMTLKAAIEAMNASTGDFSKKPPPKPPAKKTTP